MNTLDATAPFEMYLRRVWTAVGIVAFAVLLGMIAVLGVHVFLVAFFGVLWGCFLYRVSYNVSRWTGIPYGWSMAAISLLLTVAVLAAFYLFGRQFSQQMVQVVDRLREISQTLRDDPAIERWIKRLPDPESAIGGSTAITNLKSTVGSVSEILGEVAIVYVVGLYFAHAPRMYYNGIVKLFPKRLRPRCGEVLNALGNTLWNWTIGRLAAMAIIGVVTGIGLWLLGMPLAAGLGVLAGLLTFIPTVGPILAAAPAVLIAFQQGPWESLYVLVLYSIVQGAELKLVTPIIQLHVVRMPPSVQLISQSLFWWFMGLLGLTLATPITALVMVLVKELYVRDALGDPDIDSASTQPVESNGEWHPR